jgi:lysophospholipase L1-like esterase
MARQVLIRLGLVGAGIGFALCILELGLRVWFSTQGTELDRARYLYDRATLEAKNPSALFVGVPYLNYTLNPEAAGVNERGIRGRLVEVPKPPGVFRIVALGGSTTYGHNLEVSESWPNQLQQTLLVQYSRRNVEVINLGVPGYNSLDSVVNLATRGLALEPDLIIVYDGVNDIADRLYEDPACYQTDTPLFGIGKNRGTWQPASRELPPSALYRFAALQFGWMEDPTTITGNMGITGWCPPASEIVADVSVLAQKPPIYFERNERSIAAIAQSGGVQILFSSIAWDVAAARQALAADPSLKGTETLMLAIDEHNALIQKIAEETGALFVDLAGEMGDGPYFQGDQLHQSAEGTRRQAEIYARYLIEQGIIPEPGDN